MRIFCLMAGAILCVATAMADVYRSVDSSGQVHYSDRYSEGAQKVDVGPLSTYKPPPAPKFVPGQSSPAAAEGGYEEFAIQQPLPDEGIRANDGRIPVSLLVRPALREGDRIGIALDGTAHPEKLSTTQFTLQDVARGTHSLRATVHDATGAVLIEADEVTFHVLRAAVGERASANQAR